VFVFVIPVRDEGDTVIANAAVAENESVFALPMVVKDDEEPNPLLLFVFEKSIQSSYRDYQFAPFDLRSFSIIWPN